ncbi:MAG: 4-hydroxythreonine-4-phosphate dehydrogenase PdxA [Candidatus Sumerlaeaceae bacterium]|nr:4-hydroxythreonine-4-phosphate dehydrogenase PdxA [Candidatus Sumerlaeaceae bacterium]
MSKMASCIAIAMGDPGGIGPRLIAHTLAKAPHVTRGPLLIFGDETTIREAAALDGIQCSFEQVDEEQLAGKSSSCLSTKKAVVVRCRGAQGLRFSRGIADAANGRAALAWIEAAVKACQTGIATSLVTAPISKEAIRAAGSPFPGHTELLAHLCGIEEVRMMLVGGGLRVVLETIHVALAEVPKLLAAARIQRTLEIIAAWSGRYLCKDAKIAVCGLNPHAGENGLFGREELDVIAPAIAKVRSVGIDASGPYPADTVFYRARRGEFDFVLAMYHDQGLAVLKTLAFETGVNVTLGLPFVRTSPDHGTAFDRAWLPDAKINTRSFQKALELAARWSRQEARMCARAQKKKTL